MNWWGIIFSILLLLAASAGVFLFLQLKKTQKHLTKRETELEAKVYEIAILKELGERIGYSLNIRKIIDIISGSLAQFIDYTAVAYLIAEPDSLIFNVHLEKSVDVHFIMEVKNRMLASLAALTDDQVAKRRLEATTTGAIVLESLGQPVRSYFNIPVVIRDRTIGILTVASTKPGLYREEEMTILYKITSQASQAVSRLQEVLAIEEEKLNAMIASMPDGLLMTDKDFRVVAINPACIRSLGLTGARELSIFSIIDALGKTLDIHGKLDEAMKLDRMIVVDNVALGDKMYQVLISPVKTQSAATSRPRVFGAVALFHDVTREKELERMREDFTSMMVHELRAPLDGIKKLIELLQTGKRRSAKVQKDFLHMIHTSSAEMLTLVSSLLDIAKLESGKFQIIEELHDIKTLLQAKMPYFKPQAADKHISLDLIVPDSLAPLSFDIQRIGQVLNNLLSNALKFTAANGRVVIRAWRHEAGSDFNGEAQALDVSWHAITTGTVPRRDCCMIAVTDTGVGIPADELPHIFTKFRQLTAGTQLQKGTGLGLVIAKGIVEAHGGVMLVGSEEGRGTTFLFTLPLNNNQAKNPNAQIPMPNQ